MLNVKNTKNIKIKIFTLVIVALLVAGGALYYRKSTQQASNTQQTENTVKPEINFGPPTEEEKQAADDVKEQVIQKEANQNTNPSQPGATNVKPIITYASAAEVNAYVPGIFEEGGVCTALFTQGDIKISRTSQAFGNVSNTQCAPITPNLPNNQTWSLTVSYKSAISNGSSETREVKQ